MGLLEVLTLAVPMALITFVYWGAIACSVRETTRRERRDTKHRDHREVDRFCKQEGLEPYPWGPFNGTWGEVPSTSRNGDWDNQ